MARPGDVVAFKSGLHGIDAPENLGILLGRERRKGTPWVELVTVQGPLWLKAEHLSGRAFRDRYDGNLKQHDEVQQRLRFLIGQHAQGALAEEAEDDLGRLEEQLWDAVADDPGPYSEEQLAAAWFDDPSPQQIKDVRAALDRCRRPGIGRFETAGKGDQWRPWTRDEVAQMRQAMAGLDALRDDLIEIQETDEGRMFCRREPGDLDAHAQTMAWVEAAMRQFIEHDKVVEPVAGIGGLGAVQAFGMDLHRRLEFLAADWIQSGSTTRSSDYLHFLLEIGRWTPMDAVDALTRRHVNREPFFEHVPDHQAAADAAALPDPAPEPGRDDLRHLTCYTIDPPDAKDFDDAVGLEVHGDTTRLWVHIADVSHYVRQGTHLDRHAKNRATSVYLPGKVLPMLPARIADHLCSLRDDGDRFAMSVAMDVDANGRITGTAFHKSLIRVTQNLRYDDALARRDAGESDFVALFDLAQRMRSQRRGLAIETGEVRVAVGDAFEAVTKYGNDATQMIETFMVAANEAVARHLADESLPLLYRCHPLPDATKAERFRHQLATMGLDVPFALPETAKPEDEGQSLLDQLKAGGKLDLKLGMSLGQPEPDPEPEPDAAPEATGFATMTPEEQDAWLAPFRTVLDELKALGSARAEVAVGKLLACMGQAYYTPENQGHFGLGSTHYCHFTSPIRRYPDLVVHRNLKWRIEGRQGPMPHQAEDLQRMCDHCSDQERAASELERRVKNACMVLASMHGETAFAEAPARITGIIPSAVFIRLAHGIEARIAGRDLPGGPFHVDDWESMLYRMAADAPDATAEGLVAHFDEETGESRQVRARLGDAVAVRLAGRDVAEGKTGAELTRWKA
ncbi:MAG: RNB domain-containing ribonuclease [Thermoplasmatota archaeon]